MDVVEESVDRLRREILDALRYKGPEQKLSIEFRLMFFNFYFMVLGTQQNRNSGLCFRANGITF